MRRRTQVALILGLVVGIGPLSIDMYLPALPAMSHSLGAGTAGLQLTLTACLAGLALGQLISGPLSDSLGRKPPLIVALGIYLLASLSCAFAPSIAVLIAARLVQGTAGGAGTVIARAVVRDMYVGAAAARYFTGLMLVNGVAPVLSPVLGGQLLRVTSWRTIFISLAAFALLVQLWTVRSLPETTVVSDRRRCGISDVFAVMKRLLADRAFVPYALTAGFVFGGAFSYTAGSPFVLENVYGVSAQLYGVLFAVNASGLIAVSQLNRTLLRRFAPRTILLPAVGVAALGGAGILLASASGSGSLLAMLIPAFALVSSLGIVLPNAAALALSGYGDSAGSASAVFGVLQYLSGAAIAPLDGVAGSETALPMGILTATMSFAALAVLVKRRPQKAHAVGKPAGRSWEAT